MITPGTEGILQAAARWRDDCLLGAGSVFLGARLWTREGVEEVQKYFVERPDESARTFLEKLKDQLAPSSNTAKQLAAEMLWVLLLFPSNVRRSKKTEIITTVWSWSGQVLQADHPMLVALGGGIGSGGMGYNNYRPYELEFLIQFLRSWKAKGELEHRALLTEPWQFAEYTDSIPGADRRQFRHMLLHLLFPETFERVASGSDKSKIDRAFADRLRSVQLTPEESSTTLLSRDRRLHRIIRSLQQEHPGAFVDFYRRPFIEDWRPEEEPDEPGDQAVPGPPRVVAEQPERTYAAPATDLMGIASAIRGSGLRISDRTLRRYHLALHSRGFVILSGVSGTGKTWLAEEYARASGARYLVVPVAPNWTTNEDLLGFTDPFTNQYRDTAFSQFLREAAVEHEKARSEGRAPRDFHLILDELNLARVEYYFAVFLSKMETRMRDGTATLPLGASGDVVLGPNLRFVGTVNVDETTHGFADKVYDRAQLIEIESPREALQEQLGAVPYASFVLDVWDAVAVVAPFAFRVIDDMGSYVSAAGPLAVRWEELLDELLLQKVLPKIRGTDPRVRDALRALQGLTATGFPLSHAKVSRMIDSFDQQGVASYF